MTFKTIAPYSPKSSSRSVILENYPTLSEGQYTTNLMGYPDTDAAGFITPPLQAVSGG
jgi:hypothetical protein